MDISENKGCFENEAFEEDAILESLFIGCDTEGTGLVNVSKLVEYLSLTVTGDNVDFGGNFNDLTHLLDPNGKDVAIDIKTYRKGMKNWIEGIRSDSYCEEINDENNGSPMKYEFNDVTEQFISPNKTQGSAKNYSSESVEGIAGESPQKQEWDLIAKIEDLQLTNKRISEHNTELSAQMENTEETNGHLLQELAQLQKIIRSYQCLEEKKKNLEKENEELRQTVSDLQETNKNFQNKAKQLEKEKAGLTESLEEVKNKFAMVNRRLENLSKDHKNVCNAYNEEKLAEMEELKIEKINNKMSDDTQEYLKNVICNLTSQKETLQIERNKMEGELIKVREELAGLSCHSGSAFRTPVTRALYNGTPGGKSSTVPNSLQQELSQELSYDDYLPSPLVGCSRFPSNNESSLESDTSVEDLSLHLPNISLCSPAIADDVFTNQNVGKAKFQLEKMCTIIKKLKSAIDSEKESRVEAEKKIDELRKLNEELNSKNKDNLDKLNNAERELQRANLNLQVEKKRAYGLEESLSFSMLKHEDELKDILLEIPNAKCETTDVNAKMGHSAVTAVQVRNKLRELLALKQLTYRDSPDGRPKTNDDEVPLCASTPTTEHGGFRPKRFTQCRAPQSSTPRVASPIIKNIVESSALHDNSQNTTASSIVSPNLIAPFHEDTDFSVSPSYINPFQNDAQTVGSLKQSSLRAGSPATRPTSGPSDQNDASQRSVSTGRFSLDGNLRKRCIASQDGRRLASSLDDSVIKRERNSVNSNKDNGLVFTFDDMPDVCRTGSNSSFGTRSNLPTDDDELKDMFDSVALSFRKDKRTLRQRLTSKEKDRDDAESVVADNLKSLSSSIEGLENSLNSTTSKQVLSESLNSLCQQISFLKESTRQVSSNSTQFGCVQQEARMMSGVDVLINYGENVSRNMGKMPESLEQSQGTSAHSQDFLSLDLICQDECLHASNNSATGAKLSASFDKSLKEDGSAVVSMDQRLGCTKDSTVSRSSRNETNNSIKLEKRSSDKRFGVKRYLSWLFGLIVLFLLIVVVIFCGAKYSVIDRDFVVHQLQANLRRFEVKHFGHEPAV